MKRSFRISLIALVAVLAFLAAACGSGGEPAGPAPTVSGSDEPAGLPANPDPDATPPIATGTCIEDEPDCVDTVVGDGAPAGMLFDGGLAVADALTTDATGVIAVSGFLFVDDQGARLCELLAESFPAQCGGASIPVQGHEGARSVVFTQAQGVSWTDQHVSLRGELVDGTFVVDALSL